MYICICIYIYIYIYIYIFSDATTWLRPRPPNVEVFRSYTVRHTNTPGTTPLNK